MAHKRNPSLSEKILPLTKKVRYNAALVTEVMVVEHERDLNFMYVEMSAITESLIIMGELLTATEDLVKGLVVFPNRMARNLDALKGLIVSESIMLKMGKKIGKQASYNIIYENAMKTIDEGVSFKEMLLKDNRVIQHFSETEIEQMLDPKNYVGLAGKLAMDAVNLSRKERELDRQLQ
jgi:adenylosuccinate lyase